MRRQVPTRPAATDVPAVPAVPPRDPTGAPNRPLSQAASATSTRTVQPRRNTDHLPHGAVVRLSSDEHGNDPAHDGTHDVHEVVASSRHSTDDARSFATAMNAPFGGLGAMVAPPPLLDRR